MGTLFVGNNTRTYLGGDEICLNVNERLAQVRFLVWMPAKEATRATQLKSVHAWVALFDSNFIGTINFIAKISGQRNE